MKYFVLFFRNKLNYIVRFRNRKKSLKFVWKNLEFFAKGTKFRAKIFYDNS